MSYLGLLKTNLIADTDSYKLGHWNLINPKLDYLYSYGEARIGNNMAVDRVAFAGMQPILLKHFSQPVTKEDLEEAIELDIHTHGKQTLNTAAWNHVIKTYGGFLPIRIKAVQEGTIVKKGNVLFTIESLDPLFAKTVNSLEGLLMQTWYPTALLTREAIIKSQLYPFYANTGNVANLDYAVHDFGFRGGTCPEHSELGGMAHLIAFNGSDNLRASRAAKAYYQAASYPAKSVYATEHSVALSFGRGQGEKDYMLNALNNVPEDMIFSIVIDTYDAHGFIRNVAGDPEIKQKIIDRSGRVVFRPDSGEPNIIVPQILELLGEIFGYDVTQKGYKVLKHNVGVIQGDGMNERSIIELYKTITDVRWSADNLVVGSGGGLLVEGLNRDTHRFAIKPSFGIIGGEEINFMKNPATDPTKQSKPGRLKLHPTYGGNFLTISSANTSAASFNAYVDVLETVYEVGEIKTTSFEDVRKRFNDNLRVMSSI